MELDIINYYDYMMKIIISLRAMKIIVVVKKVIKESGGPAYVNTIHNKRIASAMAPDRISTKCPSFRPYAIFIQNALNSP